MWEWVALVAVAAAGIDQVFQSRSIARLYPVQGFVLEHLTTESGFLGGIRDSGIHQPFPDFVQVSFSVPSLQRHYSFRLEALHDLIDPSAVVETQGSSRKHKIVTYGSKNQTMNVVATLFDFDVAAMTVFAESLKESFQIAPIHDHETDMDSKQLKKLKALSKMTLHFLEDEHNTQSISMRRLLQRFPSSSSRWIGCNGGSQGQITTFQVGILVDAGFYRAVSGQTSDPMAVVQNFIATSNMVYEPQLGIRFQIGEAIVKTVVDNLSWNQDRRGAKKCAREIGKVLSDLRVWRNQAKPTSKAAVWHLMTDCYPPPGTVGLAYVGTACSLRPSNVGISSYSRSRTWITVAHEFGHNFGAQHTFQRGRGKTGGLMDYGNALINGVYMFNKEFSEGELCPLIKSSIQGGRGRIQGCASASGSINNATLNPNPGRTRASGSPQIPSNNPRPSSDLKQIRFRVNATIDDGTNMNQLRQMLESRIPLLIRMPGSKGTVTSIKQESSEMLLVTFYVSSGQVSQFVLSALVEAEPMEDHDGPLIDAEDIMKSLSDTETDWQEFGFPVIEVQYVLEEDEDFLAIDDEYKGRMFDEEIAISSSKVAILSLLCLTIVSIFIGSVAMIIQFHKSKSQDSKEITPRKTKLKRTPYGSSPLITP